MVALVMELNLLVIKEAIIIGIAIQILRVTRLQLVRVTERPTIIISIIVTIAINRPRAATPQLAQPLQHRNRQTTPSRKELDSSIVAIKEEEEEILAISITLVLVTTLPNNRQIMFNKPHLILCLIMVAYLIKLQISLLTKHKIYQL